MKHYMRIAAFIAAALPLLVSCRNKAVEPSTEFSSYIKAYTGGVVSGGSTVRIEFVSDMNCSENQSLFSFSPSLKGSTHWISPSVIEFAPDEDELSPGTSYKAVFHLDQVTEVKDPALRKFAFSFMVAPKASSLDIEGVVISAADPALASVAGSLSFSEPVSQDDAAKMLTVSYPGGTPQIEWTSSGEDRSHGFVIKGLSRSVDDKPLTVSMDGSAKGFKSSDRQTVDIPAINDFKVISADYVDASEPYIDVRFSEPLDRSAADKGFFTLKDAGRYYTESDANCAKVYFDAMPPSGSVSLNVSSLLRSYNGLSLAGDFYRTFKAFDVKPEVRLDFSGNILPDASRLVLPFKAIGLRAVDVSVVKIFEDNVLMFLQSNDLDGEENDLRRSGRMVFKTTARLDGDSSRRLDRWEDYSLDLSDLFKKEPGAIYRIRLSFKYEYSIYAEDPVTGGVALTSLRSGELTEVDEAVWDIPNPYYYEDFYDWDEYDWDESDNPKRPTYYMQSWRFPFCNLLTSNIGIIAKRSDTDMLWTSVTDILTAKPVSGAEVTAYNYQLQPVGSAKTDADGFADFKTSSKPFAIVVRSGNSTGYLKVTEGDDKSLSRFDTGGKALSSGLKGYVYGERGVWRPGDTLHVSLLIEDREKVIPASHPVTMELYNPQGQFYSKVVNTSGVNGLYVFNVPTRDSDPTGSWNAYFKVGGATFHKALPVETVKANRLKVDLKVAGSVLKSDEAAEFELASNWLTGPAASGLKAVAEVTVSRGSSSFKGYEGYTFVNPVSDFSSSSWTLFERTLDDKGRTSVSVRMPEAEDAPGMLKANIVTRVMEPGGDASITAQTVQYAPYKAFVGIKFPEDMTNLETDTDHVFPVAVVDADGRSVNGHKLEYKVYKLDWSWWWESGDKSLDSYVNGRSATPVSEGTMTSGQSSAVKFRVDYPEWGRYLVYVRDLTGGHATGGIIYLDWPSWRGHSDKSDPNGLTMLSFTTDRKSYEVGETVTVYVPAAEDGRALVSLENGGRVISREWVRTAPDSDTKYTFEVTPEMAPNFYVHISLLQPHRHTANDLPLRMYGVQPVLVSNKDSHLCPEIAVPDVIRPQEEFTVSVRERSGKPMTYTLAVVDEGLLDITSFKTPDPWTAMNAREALGVRTWDMFDNVVGAFSGKFSPLMSIGGDEDVRIGNRKENRFNPVVKFYGPFTLEKGTAKHRITLPMYVGSVRVMVVAGQDGAYGSAERTVPVRTPLMVLPTLPRVLGTSEKVVLPVNVFAMEDNIRNVNVKVSVEGPVSLGSAASSTLEFSGAGDKLADFTLVTGMPEGTAKVTVTAVSGSYKASETINVEVRNPAGPAALSESRLIAGGRTASFAFEPFKADGEHWAKLQLSNFPAVDFNGLFSFVRDYQYDCTEQLSAKGMVLVYTRKFLSEDNSAKAEKMINEILRALYARQLPDGGFAYWPGQAVADEWASSMAGQFMTEASSLGFPVNKGVVAAWRKFQSRTAGNYKHTEKYKSYDLQQAYRLYTLALAGSADEGAMNRLKAAPAMTDQARWRLAAAYAVNGKKNVARQLIGTLDTSITDAGPAEYTYGSDNRDVAMLLETAVLADEMQVAMSLAEQVADVFRNGSAGTQYTAFAALAMSRLADKVGDSAIDVELSGAASGRTRTAKSTCMVELDPSSGTLEVSNLASEAVYATIRGRVPVAFDKPVAARASNISISVKYTDMSGKPLNPASLRQGQDFRATVTVANSSAAPSGRRHLALTEIVPSGWEIFNERLFDEAAETSAGYDRKDVRDDRVIWYFDLPASGRKEFSVRLQAAYAGEFVLPAVSCEAMYDSDTYASTASGKTVVER